MLLILNFLAAISVLSATIPLSISGKLLARNVSRSVSEHLVLVPLTLSTEFENELRCEGN